MKKAYESPTIETTRLSIASVICGSAEGEEITGKPIDPWG